MTAFALGFGVGVPVGFVFCVGVVMWRIMHRYPI